MQKVPPALVFIFLVVTTFLCAQDAEISRLMQSELKMTFPSVYFKHNSTDYAVMPYKADSCFRYIALHMEHINSLVIWRDSSETELLTGKRIKKLQAGINRYLASGKTSIKSMGSAQKISQRTIQQAGNNKQLQYLLSLNSVFDVSGAIVPNTIPANAALKKSKRPHTEHPRIWCTSCWKRGRFSKEYRLYLKQQRTNTQTTKQ